MDRIAFKDKAVEFLKKYRYVLLILLIGLVLMCIPDREETDDTPTPAAAQEETVSMEQRLEEILAQIEGAGKVKVLLTEQTGERVIYQSDEDLSQDADSSSSRRDTVIVTGSDRSEQGLVTQTDPPVYLGAVIVCQGGDRASVRLAIVEAVSNATGLGADKISVLKMK